MELLKLKKNMIALLCLIMGFIVGTYPSTYYMDHYLEDTFQLNRIWLLAIAPLSLVVLLIFRKKFLQKFKPYYYFFLTGIAIPTIYYFVAFIIILIIYVSSHLIPADL